MSRIMQAWKGFRMKPTLKLQVEKANSESSACRALKKQIALLEDINTALEGQVRDMLKTATQQRQGDTEAKLIDAVVGIFAPGASKNGGLTASPGAQFIGGLPSDTQQTLESGIKYTDEETEKILKTLPPTYLSKIAASPKMIFSQIVKSQIPNISDESIKIAHKMAKKMVKNEG